MSDDIKRELIAQIIFKEMVHPTNDWNLKFFDEDKAACYKAADDILTVLKPSED